jgi:GTP cyclohydrolase I
VDQDAIREAVRTILTAIGEDPDRAGVAATPDRIARMYEEVFAGVGRDPADELDVTFVEEYDELILVRDIPLYSFCEHHLLPFTGKAHVGYVPNDKGQITGLSKLARVVDIASRRPQVQERLTVQIADAISARLDPKGVIVVLEAEHLCMAMRGIRKPGATMVTSVVRGAVRRNPATREEAMRLIRGR